MQHLKNVANRAGDCWKNTMIICAKFISYYEGESAMLQNKALRSLVDSFLKNVMHKYQIIRRYSTHAVIWVQIFTTLISKLE